MENKIDDRLLIKGIRIVGPHLDGSGYGFCARRLIAALHKKSVPMKTHIVSFEKDRPDLGEEGELIMALSEAPTPWDVNIVRLSAEIAQQFIDPNALNIINFAWETSKLPNEWVEYVNRFDGAIVESKFVHDACVESGVIVPIYIVPNAIDYTSYIPKEKPKEGTYLFYTIAQWLYRKNIEGLLKAYWNAFDVKDDVRLILKTYLQRVEPDTTQVDEIKKRINDLKLSLQLQKELPPIYLVTEKLSTEALIQMHNDCDCYVLLEMF